MEQAEGSGTRANKRGDCNTGREIGRSEQEDDERDDSGSKKGKLCNFAAAMGKLVIMNAI